MSNRSKKEYLQEICVRYKRAEKDEKQTILDEFCNVCGYNRKYAIRVLNRVCRSRFSSSLRNECSRRIYKYIKHGGYSHRVGFSASCMG